ncbi:hypothetical protein WR25_12539 [Diploscapter pachys]|uniref:Neurotransmitter-gated ion-channel ligand-binding domain-containing protein n=1 Tax=Diploscapter pachys TaxID=2018661 RepID=A0A2A2JUP5_9BILA|nr:hypothetical protein WR25_12539 [Diploscapter pachys]
MVDTQDPKQNSTLLEEVQRVARERPNLRTEADLVTTLMQNYNQNTRPVKNHKHVINITSQMQLYSLVDISWTDEFLQWSPQEWDDLRKINLPTSMIWLPDGHIFNTVDTSEPLVRHNARVRYDGFVEVDFNKLIDVTCPMRVLMFPFDEQTCSLQFGSWSYTSEQISFHVLNALIYKGTTNSEWEILDFVSEKIITKYNNTVGGFNEYEEIFYKLKLRRKPLYYIVVILIPAFLIVTVSNIGLFTPHGVTCENREEHVSLGLTTMLTMAVILDMVTAEMPRSAEGIPLLGMYVLVEFMISVVAVLVSVVIIFAHERMLYMEVVPPAWVVNLVAGNEVAEEVS